MRRVTVVLIALVALQGVSTTTASAATAAAFRNVVLERLSGKGPQYALIIHTKGIDPASPGRVVARANGNRARAKRLTGCTGPQRAPCAGPVRWLITRRVEGGHALIHSVRDELASKGHSRVTATIRFPCGSFSRSWFSVTGYGDPAPAHFDTATGCV